MNAAEVLSWLRDTGTESVRQSMTRYAIPNDRALGISVGELKRFAKTVGRDQALAIELWESEWYEARTLAAFVAIADEFSGAQMDRWAHDFDSWAICDTTCFHLFDRSPHAWSKVAEWADAEPEFVKRGSFALLWGLSVHDKKAPDAAFVEGLELVLQAADDERRYVKKAVDMALRAIGKRNASLNAAAIAVAETLANREAPAPIWIGRHALRELQGDSVRRRLGQG